MSFTLSRAGRRLRPVIATAAVLVTTALLSPDPALAAPAPPQLGRCAAGELCLWQGEDFQGFRQAHELAGIAVDSCTPLPTGRTAGSLANRTGRPVTTYQSAECAETGEFETYPGGGTWTPRSPYRVRAFKVWEN
jgi:peptidase inhibitor family I36